MGTLYKGDTYLRGFLRPHFNQVYAIKVETWMDTVGKKSVCTVYKLFALEYMIYTVVMTFHAIDSVDMLSTNPSQLHNGCLLLLSAQWVSPIAYCKLS